MLTWGAITIALGFTQGATMFYVLRFLLGAAEAGFFPGVLYALTLWFPQEHRGRMGRPGPAAYGHRDGMMA